MVGFMKSVKNMFGIKDGGGVAGGVGSLDDFLSELPQQLGFDVRFVRAEKEGSAYHYEVEGEEADSFLGANTEMLDALAHVCMRVLRRNEGLSNAPAEEGENVFRVTFDAKGFRDKKAQELKDLAAAQRQKVIDSGGKPSYIKALGPSERKIIHTTLADLGEVTSESIGRGNFKRIRVKLKDDSQFRREVEASAEDNGDGGDGVGPRRNNNNNRSGGGGGQQRGGRNNNNNRGGGSGGSGRGGRGGGRNFAGGSGGGQQRGGGRFGGENGGFRGPSDINSQGNYASNDAVEDVVDDNIGNRLAPGEEPVFPYTGDKPSS